LALFIEKHCNSQKCLMSSRLLLAALREKIRLCIQSARGQSQELLLRKLNPIIRGWANYFRHGASQRTFNRLDYHIHWQLWRWAKRRHPNKPAQ
jgi:RNA-directed DNA polymerase